MATPLDLQEQEQIDELKAFWKQYGNLITWTLVIVLGAFAAWNGWNMYQRDQSLKASAMFDELERAAQGGDLERSARVFGDLKERYAGTVYAQQAGLLTAKLQYDKGQADAALASLAWVADQSGDEGYRSMARLRAAGVLLDKKQYDAALAQLEQVKAPSFAGLAADRRGDVLLAQGKKDEARAAFESAYRALEPSVEYRRLVEAKLMSLGVAPPATPASGAAK